MASRAISVVELRQYTLHPGRRDELIELFEREFIEPQAAAGIALLGLFRDAERPDRFVWMRGFSDMPSRRDALETFYDGPCWKGHRDTANATMIDSDNVLLLRPADASLALPKGEYRGPLLAVTYLFSHADETQHFVDNVVPRIGAAWKRDGGEILVALASEHAENTFPRLPVREGEHAVVVLTSGIEADRLRTQQPQPSDVIHLVPTARSQIQLSATGARGDFDFLVGDWSVRHKKLHSRLTACTEWTQELGTCRGYALADGIVSVDEFDFPASQMKACSIRTMDVASRRWTIHWTTSRTGRLFAPVHGGFHGDRGEFYGYDVESGYAVFVRYIWSACSTPHPRWEQAFSTDGGGSWETNWIMHFSRVEA